VRCSIAAGLVGILVQTGTAAGGPNASRLVAAQRALASYAAMQHYFFVPGKASYEGTYPKPGHAQVWPYSQALWATLELARVPGAGAAALASVRSRITALRAYGHPKGDEILYDAVYGGRKWVFYDDNAWISLALIDASDLLHERSLLMTARRVFAPMEAGWDSNPSDACSGGVFWIRSPRIRQRGAVSTANGALIAALLYLRTHDHSYLTCATRAYRWSQRCLGLPSGLVADHIDPDGTVDTRTWSYNQGAMIAAGVSLYEATHDRTYLRDAEQTANAALVLLRDPLASGDPASFLAIFYRDLLTLAALDGDPRGRAAVESFGDAAWASRDTRTGLFHFGHTQATLLDQAAMVQVYALLAAP
jgi:Glycosyl hydrolase family 76